MNEVHPLVYRMRLRRFALGWSQQQLANRVGTTQSAISDFETGNARLRLATFERMASALGFQLQLVDAPVVPGRSEP